MRLSIITINYNNLVGLEKTIKSVKEQSFSDYEWIVIDGGSSDGSKALLEREQVHFSYWCSESDKGIYNAINKGIMHATGDYIQILNSGDWLYSADTLAKVFAHDYTSDVLYGDMMQVNETDTRLVCYPDNLGLFFFLYDSLCHQATFFKRHLFESNLYDETYHIAADWAMNIKLILEGCQFEHLAYPIVYYDNNGISSDTSSTIQGEERMRAYNIYIPHHLRVDIDNYNRNYYFTRKRKTLRILMDSAIKWCHHIDNSYVKMEQLRKKIFHK